VGRIRNRQRKRKVDLKWKKRNVKIVVAEKRKFID
jgi:hypothetical protein